ncbi:MAG TPA: GNAT family N-acetyltransferase [Rugosimonospora sp.]|nr:GNAT family N-acetyltransferase [Rugosimonospora sp.]
MFRSQPLADHHDLNDFDCGVPSLTGWLREQAQRARSAGTARTQVWTPQDSQKVVAYYSIAPTQIARGEVGGKMAGGYSVIPAYLLARLALDRSLRGHGYGTDLLLDAVELIQRAAHLGGGRLIVVDALNERVSHFYHRHGFHPVKDNPLRLVMKMSTARAVFRTGLMQLKPDRGTGLAAIVLSSPDGSQATVVVSPDEMRALADRLSAEPGPLADANLREAIRAVLGRDPFVNG